MPNTIPPRLLLPGYSTWLYPNEPIHEKHQFEIINTGKGCFISQDKYRHPIFINGQPHLSTYLLQDGDFLQFNGTKAIFQADPVGDFCREIESSTVTEIVPEFSSGIQLKVFVDIDGVSFDAGKTVIQWENLRTLGFEAISVPLRFGPQFRLTLLGNKSLQVLIVSTKKEAIALCRWLMLSAPYHMSLRTEPKTGIDAYYWAAWTKVILPAEKGQRLLSISRGEILDPVSKKDRRGFNIILIVALLIPLGLSFIANFDNQGIRAMAICYAIIFAPFTILLFTYRILPWISRKLHR